MNVLRDDIVATLTVDMIDSPKYNFILHFIVTMSLSNQAIQLSQLLSNVIMPLLPKGLKKLQEDKVTKNCYHKLN